MIGSSICGCPHTPEVVLMPMTRQWPFFARANNHLDIYMQVYKWFIVSTAERDVWDVHECHAVVAPRVSVDPNQRLSPYKLQAYVLRCFHISVLVTCMWTQISSPFVNLLLEGLDLFHGSESFKPAVCKRMIYCNDKCFQTHSFARLCATVWSRDCLLPEMSNAITIFRGRSTQAVSTRPLPNKTDRAFNSATTVLNFAKKSITWNSWPMLNYISLVRQNSLQLYLQCWDLDNDYKAEGLYQAGIQVYLVLSGDRAGDALDRFIVDEDMLELLVKCSNCKFKNDRFSRGWFEP